MPQVSLSEGARMVGRSKGTLSKALSSGKMSFIEKTDNGYLIDTSELFRAFPPKQAQPVVEARLETPMETAENMALRVEVDLLRQRVSELATDRDAWRDQAQRLLLEGPQAHDEQPVSNRSSWWRWKRG